MIITVYQLMGHLGVNYELVFTYETKNPNWNVLLKITVNTKYYYFTLWKDLMFKNALYVSDIFKLQRSLFLEFG